MQKNWEIKLYRYRDLNIWVCAKMYLNIENVFVFLMNSYSIKGSKLVESAYYFRLTVEGTELFTETEP